MAPAVDVAAPVAGRFEEGVSHGFLTLRTADATQIASGDLLQVVRGGEVESRMLFRFRDGSVLDETVVFTQQRVFAMKSYRLSQKGPAFAEDTEISLERASGKYRVKTTARKDAREEVVEGMLELPADTYNGMVVTVAKNLPKGASETVHVVAFTPAARIVPVELAPRARAQGAGGRACQDRHPLRVQGQARRLAGVPRHRARPDAAGLARVDPHRGDAGVREVRGPAASGGSGLAHRADKPALA
jgi:hypothetical protein